MHTHTYTYTCTPLILRRPIIWQWNEVSSVLSSMFYFCQCYFTLSFFFFSLFGSFTIVHWQCYPTFQLPLFLSVVSFSLDCADQQRPFLCRFDHSMMRYPKHVTIETFISMRNPAVVRGERGQDERILESIRIDGLKTVLLLVDLTCQWCRYGLHWWRRYAVLSYYIIIWKFIEIYNWSRLYSGT